MIGVETTRPQARGVRQARQWTICAILARMLNVKVSPGGIRGRVDALELGVLIDLVSAFATWLEEGPVVVARDTRPSSPMFTHAALAALSAAGREVLDLGVCPTAVALHAAARHGAAGALSVTASHNGATWNGLKLFGRGGRVLSALEGEEVLDLWHQGEYAKARHDALGRVRPLEGAVAGYLDELVAGLDGAAIAAARLRVVVDACNGAAVLVVPELCRRLGVELVPLNGEPSGFFPHLPDPTAQNLGGVAAIMRPVAAHAGFGLSSDGERVSLVTEEGRALGTSATLPLLVEAELAATPGAPVVASVASDGRVDRVAARHGSAVLRSGVGAMAVLGLMAEEGAAVGGESSGGVALARFQLAFDGVAGLARLLESLASRRASELAADLPEVHARSTAVRCPVALAYSTVARLRAYAEGEVTDLDGVRVQLEDAWYFLRVSQTEPVIRVICEAATRERADDLLFRLERQVRAAIGA